MANLKNCLTAKLFCLLYGCNFLFLTFWRKAMNKIILSGNLVKDPESKVLPNGTTVVNFTIATNRKFTKKDGTVVEEVNFFPCEGWDSGAETIAKYFSKGSPILVEGTLKNDQWEKDGQKHTLTKIRVERFEFFQTRKDKASNSESDQDQSEVGAGVGDDENSLF